MTDLTPYIIIVFALAVALFASRLLVDQIGKLVSKKFKPYFYTVLELIPIYEMIRLIINYEKFYKILYFYFWVIFLIGLIILFSIELKKTIHHR
ncbi:hypothetical protein B6I21_05810 [candidate division KSB1 bacterium 4572_119]|nr:MAG: hypothetical protein B6I21_05810 [candidate division KSB1 bacterium 4572_119]